MAQIRLNDSMIGRVYSYSKENYTIDLTPFYTDEFRTQMKIPDTVLGSRWVLANNDGTILTSGLMAPPCPLPEAVYSALGPIMEADGESGSNTSTYTGYADCNEVPNISNPETHDDPCPEDACCPADGGDRSNNDRNSPGTMPSGPGTMTMYPVQYKNGQIAENIIELSTSCGGIKWSHNRKFDNLNPVALEYRLGYRWKLETVPTLHFFNSSTSITESGAIDKESVQVSYAPGRVAQFDRQGTDTWIAHGGNRDTMIHNAADESYEIHRENGDIWIFNDFSNADLVRGALRSMTTLAGTTLTVQYNQDKSPSSVLISWTENNTVYQDKFSLSYVACDDNISRIQYALLHRSDDGGSTWSDVKRVKYEYYGSDETFGSVGALKRATHQLVAGGAWVDTDVHYYRYYKSGDTNGFDYGLKDIIEPADYANLANAIADPLTATNEQIAPYITKHFVYDSNSQKVTSEAVHGASEAFTLRNFDGTNSTDVNSWFSGTQETYADGSTKYVYLNRDGQILLTCEKKSDSDSNNQVINHYAYDNAGNMTWHYTPESIEHFYAYNDYYSSMDVGHKSNDGLIHKKEYQTSIEGQPSGYLYRELVKKGTNGTEIVKREYQYVSQTIVDELTESSRDVWFVSSIKDYPYETGNDPIETRFEYTFYENSPQMEQKITVLPVVTPGRNGSGTTSTRTERFDIQGHSIWTKDELGIINCNVYDQRRDVRTRSILDVDITKTSDFTMSVPTGWTTPQGAGKHLVTDYEYDLLGRLVQSLGPQNIVINNSNETMTIRPASWIVYDDINNRILSATGYAALDVSNAISGYTLVNPISITIRNAAGSVQERIHATRESTSGPLLATDTFAQSSYVAWEKYLYDTSGRLTAVRKYHDIPESGAGESGTNYTETLYSYDVRNRQNRLLAADGTIMRNVHDWRGNVIQTWIGTEDTGATDTSPHPNNAATNNMVIVSETEYGTGSGSCPTCSGSTDQPRVAIQHVDAETSRATEFGYDWRGRRTHIHHEEDENGNLTYTVQKYDNMDRMIKSELWLVASSINEGDPNEEGLLSSDDSEGSSGSDDDEPSIPEPVDPEDTDTSNQGNRLLSRTRQYYDQRGNVCKTEQSVVDPATGTVQGLMLGQNWYDAKGRAIKSQSVGENTFTKTVYDSIGRAVKTYTVLDTDETAYNEGSSLEGDTVFQQTEVVYDNAGNILTNIVIQRKEDAPGTGALTSSNGKYQISANWYDGANRQIASANYGDNGGEAFTRPATVPTRSDSVLLTESFYDNAGRAWKTVDPAGKDHRIYFDDLGRTVKTIANYVSGTANAEHPDQDVTIEYTYHSSGQLATLTAVNPTTGNQITRYAYGTAKTALSPQIYRNDLFVAEVYPDSDDFENIGKNLQKGEDSVDDRVEYQYNRQSEKIRKRDQNGSFHRYNYDNFGRMTQDRITVFGSGVDTAVRRIATTYTVTGQVKTITSYANPTVGLGAVVNQVRYEYDSNGLLSKEYQSPTGKVDAASLYVGYTYDTTKSGEVFTKRLRPTAVYYPSGTIVLYDYGQPGSYNDLLNRIESIQKGDTTVVSYRYQGVSTPICTTYSEPNVALDYTAQDALDRFGRITDHAWKNSSAQDLVRIKHGYDRIGNRLYREDTVASSLNQHFDELYSYDEINQVTGMTRGQLNATKTAIESGTTYAETFAFDSTGNWTGYNQDTNGDGTFELNQLRTHNAANELTAISNSTSNITTDANGNMTKVPKPDTWGAGYNLVYDGWNRLIEVIDSLTINLVAQYEYNGLNHRVLKKTYTNGNLTETREFFFNKNWQCLEEYLVSSDTPNLQYTWGQRYIDDLICRDRDTSQSGTLTERLYSLADPNWNVVAVMDEEGTVQERTIYSAFGKPSTFTGDFATARSTSAYNWRRTFTGQVRDNDTGIMLYRNRYYHPTLGRFVTKDPIGYKGEDISLYRYANNIFTNSADSFGMYSLVHGTYWSSTPEEAQLCKEFAEKNAEDVRGKKGMVICKDGKPIPCVFPVIMQPNQRDMYKNEPKHARKIINQCVYEHEMEHINDKETQEWYCDCTKEPSKAHPGKAKSSESSPNAATKNECCPLKKQLECLKKGLTTCSDQACYNYVANEIKSILIDHERIINLCDLYHLSVF